MEHVRYKVIEKAGGLGEVVQVKVRDVGVGSTDVTPSMIITPLRECPASISELAGLSHGPSCPSCMEKDASIRKLQEYIRELEVNNHVNRVLNAFMRTMDREELSSDTDEQRGLSNSPAWLRSHKRHTSLPTSARVPGGPEVSDGGQPTLMEMMTDELQRHDLVCALMTLLGRPTEEEAVSLGEEVRREYTKLLNPAAPSGE
uniref:Uncharacterized protein n=1 Tax=Trypanosoma congolense (strain IL3000) TaxID=1068625 RepID=G0US60_TRYCI|nr:conserved hypothetical protein [Trypanosoma congolense IL3000]